MAILVTRRKTLVLRYGGNCGACTALIFFFGVGGRRVTTKGLLSARVGPNEWSGSENRRPTLAHQKTSSIPSIHFVFVFSFSFGGKREGEREFCKFR